MGEFQSQGCEGSEGGYNSLTYSCDNIHIPSCDSKIHKKKELPFLSMENTENASPLMEKMLHKFS